MMARLLEISQIVNMPLYYSHISTYKRMRMLALVLCIVDIFLSHRWTFSRFASVAAYNYIIPIIFLKQILFCCTSEDSLPPNITQYVFLCILEVAYKNFYLHFYYDASSTHTVSDFTVIILI